jgi:hypothetical protein
MVDPVNIGNISGVNNTRTQQSTGQRGEDRVEQKKTERASDRVEISKEALSLQEAEQAAQQARVALDGSQQSLGLDPNFDTTV